MITKGKLHANGTKLATYLTTGKDGEHAELVELRGFASDDIHEAFIDVEIQSAGTDCEKPFFHCYSRLPKHEDLDREYWLYAADRFEKELGFTGQPRAVAFHHGADGETHMHIAWSRIDTENMCAIDPGLFKNKLKNISRELEEELGLTKVSSERSPEDKTQAATQSEFEESRRLKTDLKAIRGTIRECWDRSDNGRSFMAALNENGFILTNGDRRDFVVVDHEGGHHALGKRITGASLNEIRARLSDIDRTSLPSVEEAKAQQRGHEGREHGAGATVGTAGKAKELGKTAGQIRLAFTLSDSGQGFVEALKERDVRLSCVSAEDVLENQLNQARYRDYVKENPEEAGKLKSQPNLKEGDLVAVSLYRDQPNIYFLNERTTGEKRGEVEKYLSTLNPSNLPSIKGATQDLRETAERKTQAKADERELGKIEGEIRLAYKLSQSGEGFVEGMADRGIRIAQVDALDLDRLEESRADAIEAGIKPTSPKLVEGQLIAVMTYRNEPKHFFLNQRTTGDTRDEIKKYLGKVEPSLPNLRDATALAVHDQNRIQGELREERREAWFAGRGLPGPGPREQDSSLSWQAQKAARTTLYEAKDKAQGSIMVSTKGAEGAGKMAGSAAEKLSDFVGGLLDMASPAATPEFSVGEYLNSQEVRHSHHVAMLAAHERDEAIDRMAEDMAAGRNLAASDVSHLTHADMINIKAHGDDYIREIIRQREQEEYRRHLGDERERER